MTTAAQTVVRAESCQGAQYPAAGGLAVVYSMPRSGRSGPNEDAAVVIPAAEQHLVLAVADGAGGLPAGDRAAELAVGCLAAAVAEHGPAGANGSLRGAILDGFERANREILELGVGAATTLAVAEVQNGTLRTYHAGDSGILVTGGRGKVKLLTVAHSPVAYAVEAGVLDSEEALRHDDLNVVSNFVGSPRMRIEIGPVLRLAPRDTVVLATDGVFDNLHVPEVAEIVRKGPLARSARALWAACTRRMNALEPDAPSKPDDATFILFRPGSPRRT